MASDALHCLTAISLIPVVRQHLVTGSTVAVLLQQAIQGKNGVQSEDKWSLVFQYLVGCSASMDIVLRLACSEREMLYSKCSEEMARFIQQLSQRFKVDQDMTKFGTCKQLTLLIGSDIQGTLNSLQDWQTNIQVGLRDILCSRVAPQYCQDALALARSVIEAVGVKWAFAEVQDRATYW
jgi:hypothetical protein